jgi:lysozyme family protein
MGRERFNNLIDKVLLHEGGYVCDPADPGGETKYGISKRTYPNLDIKNLTVEDAKDIYYHDWWTPLKCGEINHDLIAQKLLDTCVNVGKSAGVKILQRALVSIGERVAIDGIIGSETLKAVERADSLHLLKAMREQQIQHYQKLIKANPTLARFEKGWMKRANS